MKEIVTAKHVRCWTHVMDALDRTVEKVRDLARKVSPPTSKQSEPLVTSSVPVPSLAEVLLDLPDEVGKRCAAIEKELDEIETLLFE